MTTGAVILAAGAGSRLGGVAKALLRAGGESYLERIMRTARGAGAREVVVVVGQPYGERVSEAARAMGGIVVENPAPERGMASSVALGFAAIADTSVDAAWLWPVDHPFVAHATLAWLTAALGTHAAAQPRFEGRGGHPPLVARTLFRALAACTDSPNGARGVLAAADVVAVAVGDRAVVQDIDTPADLAEAG
ncbi:MAG: NTP transferase domain-containing protein [Kofleriaceae bacterium]|nr:NTP transferase domain-containing protein [Kofleriaceae bacterium]